jgi:hypothetical protein
VSNFWNKDEEQISEFDLIQEQQDIEDLDTQSSVSTMVEASEEDIDNVLEQSNYELSNTEANTIYNAKLRLEQARLYEMLINHDIFQGVDANEDAVAIVQNELKLYIVRRLEILLGIRKPKQQMQESQQEASFNDVEKSFLKQLSYKGTNGLSAKAEQGSPKKRVEGLNPMTGSIKKPNLSPMGEPVSKAKPPIQQQVQAPAQRPKPKKNNTEKKVKLKTSGRGRNLTAAEAMELAKKDLEDTANKKPWNQLTAKEKKVRAKEVNARHARPKPENALPMPSAAQQEQAYVMRQQLNGSSRDQSTQFNSILANVLMNKKR